MGGAGETPLEMALLAAAGALEGAEAELNRLDGFAGDGDMGITMSEVARVVREVVGTAGTGEPSRLLSACGAAVARSAPSTSGTLLATGLLRAAKALPDGPAGGTAALERCFRAATDAVQARGKASVGDRTMLDGLDAVCSSLHGSVEEGRGWPDALRLAARAATSAAEASASMLPRVGRASWVPERALGHPDAGCTMLATVLAAAAAGAPGGP
jgi:dihydroxyacetone kinase-like protein